MIWAAQADPLAAAATAAPAMDDDDDDVLPEPQALEPRRRTTSDGLSLRSGTAEGSQHDGVATDGDGDGDAAGDVPPDFVVDDEDAAAAAAALAGDETAVPSEDMVDVLAGPDEDASHFATGAAASPSEGPGKAAEDGGIPGGTQPPAAAAEVPSAPTSALTSPVPPALVLPPASAPPGAARVADDSLGLEVSMSHMDIASPFGQTPREPVLPLPLPAGDDLAPTDVAETEAGAHQQERTLAILQDLDAIASDSAAAALAAGPGVPAPELAAAPAPAPPAVAVLAAEALGVAMAPLEAAGKPRSRAPSGPEVAAVSVAPTTGDASPAPATLVAAPAEASVPGRRKSFTAAVTVTVETAYAVAPAARNNPPCRADRRAHHTLDNRVRC